VIIQVVEAEPGASAPYCRSPFQLAFIAGPAFSMGGRRAGPSIKGRSAIWDRKLGSCKHDHNREVVRSAPPSLRGSEGRAGNNGATLWERQSADISAEAFA
jgi:hypothetical protein